MRKLLICVFALLAGLAPVPTLHAAGMDSGPAANARPVDPDYESGKKAVEAGNWKTALDSFERVASRDPNNADAQNYLGYAWRKSFRRRRSTLRGSTSCAFFRARNTEI